MATKSESKTKEVKLPGEIFSQKFNPALVHQALTSYLSSKRQGSVLLKNRSDVRGGGKKPFKQKGTGRARAGTIRSPIWVGGGVTFNGLKNHTKKINKKMAKKAITSILSKFKAEKRLHVIDEIKFKSPKTKEALNILRKNKIESGLIVLNDPEENTILSIRNIKNINFIMLSDLNPYDLLKANSIVIESSSIELLKEHYSVK